MADSIPCLRSLAIFSSCLAASSSLASAGDSRPSAQLRHHTRSSSCNSEVLGGRPSCSVRVSRRLVAMRFIRATEDVTRSGPAFAIAALMWLRTADWA